MSLSFKEWRVLKICKDWLDDFLPTNPEETHSKKLKCPLGVVTFIFKLMTLYFIALML